MHLCMAQITDVSQQVESVVLQATSAFTALEALTLTLSTAHRATQVTNQPA